MDDADIKKITIAAAIVMVGVVVFTQRQSIADLVSGPKSPTHSPPSKAIRNAPPGPADLLPPPDERSVKTPPLFVGEDSRTPAERIANGQRLSHIHCVVCHNRPAPEVMPKRAWTEVLPRMASWIGVQAADEGLVNPTGFERVMASGLFPAKPMMPVRDWKDVVDYYIQTAPEQLPQPERPPLNETLDQFEIAIPEQRFDASVMTVRVNHPEGGLWVVDENTRKLHTLDAQLKWQGDPRPLASPASTIVPTQHGLLATLIGTFTPAYVPQGALVRLTDEGEEDLAGILHRPTTVLPVDLNADGQQDLAIAEHGSVLGSAFWLEKTADGFKRHTLLDLPGAITFATADFNNDQLPDLVCVTGQAREAIHLFLSTKPGEFDHRMVLTRHPAWGHSHVEVADFNRDGHPDLLVSNGDNGEINDYPPKPYNGVRIHLNDGNNNFGPADFFYPQYGTYRAVPVDFDGDGDLDIAAIAFFTRPHLTAKDGFVYLRQDEPMKFSAHTMPVSAAGRWLTMDVGDIDQDGDPDIALGALNRGPGQQSFPPQLNTQWRSNPVPVLILKNTAKTVKASR